jgi:hypothetical protein
MQTRRDDLEISSMGNQDPLLCSLLEEGQVAAAAADEARRRRRWRLLAFRDDLRVCNVAIKNLSFFIYIYIYVYIH